MQPPDERRERHATGNITIRTSMSWRVRAKHAAHRAETSLNKWILEGMKLRILESESQEAAERRGWQASPPPAACAACAESDPVEPGL
jgi:hypothetical protein